MIARFPHYKWIQKGDTSFGLAGFYMGGDEAIPFPPAFYDYYERKNLPPQRFLEIPLQGKKEVFFQIRTSDVFHDHGDAFFAAFFSYRNKLFLAGETRIWVFSENGKNASCYDLPVNAKEGGLAGPAFYRRGEKLYVFGMSKAGRHKAKVYETTLW